VRVTIRPANGNSFLGEIAEGKYSVSGGSLTLADLSGKFLASRLLQQSSSASCFTAGAAAGTDCRFSAICVSEFPFSIPRQSFHQPLNRFAFNSV
jgi:hypothetical protein